MNRAPLVYTGAAVSKFANMAMIGCERRTLATDQENNLREV